MRTAIAFKDEKGKAGFVAGLKWANIPTASGRNKVTKEVRSKVNLAQASKILIHTVKADDQIRTALGMYTAYEFDSEPVARLYSLAASFVFAYPQHMHAILLWKIDDKRVAVIVVQNGIPIADEIKNEPEAIALMRMALSGKMGEVGHAVYTNAPEAFFNGTFKGEQTSETILRAAAGKSTRLTGVPIPSTFVAAAVIAVSVLGGGSAFAYQLHAKKERARLEALAAAEDPLPPYQAMLETSIRRLGLNRQALVNVAASFENAPVFTQGWQLKRVECTANQCLYAWERKGGTTAGLLGAFPGAVLSDDSTPEVAKFIRPVQLPTAGLPSLRQAIPLQVATQYVNTYQMWRNAGITVEERPGVGDFAVWPKPTTGSVSQLPKSETLKARPITVTVPYPLAEEVLLSTPQAVWWTSMALNYSPGDMKNILTVTLTGNTYVR